MRCSGTVGRRPRGIRGSRMTIVLATYRLIVRQQRDGGVARVVWGRGRLDRVAPPACALALRTGVVGQDPLEIVVVEDRAAALCGVCHLQEIPVLIVLPVIPRREARHVL